MQVLERTAQPKFSPLLRRYTLEEFWALPEPEDRSHYDLIGGQLFMVPPPDSPHDRLDARLNRSLILFLEQNNLGGEVLHARAGIYKDVATATYLEPDMMYISDELLKREGQKRRSADIVFEYSSRSTAAYDRTTKADTYLGLGVKELWLIDSETACIEIRNSRWHEGEPEWSTRQYARGDVAESEVLAGWRVSVDELFQGLI